MSKYKILAITMAAVVTSALAACGRTESGNEISPIVQTTSAETVTENTRVTSETAAETAPDEKNELDEETAEMLRREFAEYISETDPFYRDIDPSSIKFEPYYGTYNGCEVFLPLYKSGYDEAEDRFTIAGYEMYFPCLGYVIYVYKDGEFYELEDAYENGHIGKDAVAAIAEDNHARYFYAFE